MNRLADEPSPYLLQHANNPVDWYPWGAEAFAIAAKDDKPILLSVGYSSCHWCHVMAHESFEDQDTATVMNELFVNIKVDREERPDVDALYMEATQAISGQGGWPMTAFLTPDGRPFFAGTYFPKESQSGQPGFVDVLHAIADVWSNNRDEVEAQGTQLREAIAARTQSQPSDVDVSQHSAQWLDHAYVTLEAAYDKEWGGFGGAPKFPQTMALELLLARGSAFDVDIVTNTLDAMASGGIYDHIGGGFSRYSVDAFWMVPHFEKMLYDQAALARIYLHAHAVLDEERFAQVATETIEYVLRDLAAPEGGWYSAQDADSEGEEGKFYVWRVEDIPEEAHEWYGVTKSGNFEGSNILHRPERGSLIRPPFVEAIRRDLLAKRAERVHPGMDDKIITEWNAMFIATLAEAGVFLDKREWIEEAERAARFLFTNLRDDHDRWLRSWHHRSPARHLGFANDYAWLTEAFVQLWKATNDEDWKAHAVSTADAMLERFWDDERGGLFTTANDGEPLIVRAKDFFDGATASANSTAAVALIELANVTGADVYSDRALSIIKLVADPLAHHPTAFTNMCRALQKLQ